MIYALPGSGRKWSARRRVLVRADGEHCSAGARWKLTCLTSERMTITSRVGVSFEHTQAGPLETELSNLFYSFIWVLGLVILMPHFFLLHKRLADLSREAAAGPTCYIGTRSCSCDSLPFTSKTQGAGIEKNQ